MIKTIKEVDWKRERNINRGFFRSSKKLWIMICNDADFMRHSQFYTKNEAISYANSVGMENYDLIKRKRKSIPKPWKFLERAASTGKVSIAE